MNDHGSTVYLEIRVINGKFHTFCTPTMRRNNFFEDSEDFSFYGQSVIFPQAICSYSSSLMICVYSTDEL